MEHQDLIARASADCERIMDSIPRHCDNTFKDRCHLATITHELSDIPSIKSLCTAMQTLREAERSILLCDNPSVWLLGWRMGDTTTIHDHNDSVAGVKVLSGVITERLFVFDWGIDTHKVDQWGQLVPFVAHESLRDFHAGSVISIPSPYIHQFTTPIPDETTVSLHVYSPRLGRQAYFERYQPTPEHRSMLVMTGEDVW